MLTTSFLHQLSTQAWEMSVSGRVIMFVNDKKEILS